MKNSADSREACFQVQIDTVFALIQVIPYPVIVTKPDGTVILRNNLWLLNTEHVEPDSGMDEIRIYWCNEKHLMSVWVQKTCQLSDSNVLRWKESAQELKEGLSSLVAGWRIPLPPPEKTDPLADVKTEFNAALKTVDQLISASNIH
jgi:hypothetical protein